MNIITVSEIVNGKEENERYFTESAFYRFCQDKSLNSKKFWIESKEEPCKDVFRYATNLLKENSKSVVGFVCDETASFQFESQWYIVNSVEVKE